MEYYSQNVSEHSSTCKSDDLYPSYSLKRLLHQNYGCYRGQNVNSGRCS